MLKLLGHEQLILEVRVVLALEAAFCVNSVIDRVALGLPVELFIDLAYYVPGSQSVYIVYIAIEMVLVLALDEDS